MARRRGESGLVMPSGVAVASLVVIAGAVLAFFVTGSPDPTGAPRPVAASATQHERSEAPRARSDKSKSEPREREPRERQPKQPATPQAYVEVYNNSSISGLAAQTASELQDAGWNVVGTDNWYGTIDTSTVYFGPKLKAAAELLAQDLDITRVKPAIAPMRPDRLTVILTGEYR